MPPGRRSRPSSSSWRSCSAGLRGCSPKRVEPPIKPITVPLCYGSGLMSPEFVNKLGYILAFAICAIGLDLVWGYIGVLSLCQFMFFSIGGYAMGLYLINHGPKAADGIPECLSYVMSTVGARTPPWFLPFFDFFPLAILLGMVLPALFALLI